MSDLVPLHNGEGRHIGAKRNGDNRHLTPDRTQIEEWRPVLTVKRLFGRTSMTSSPLRAIAIAACAIALAAAAPSFGPPWISIETPPNPYDAASRGAFLVVHTFHHGDLVASGVTGTAEGIVAGSRRSVPLAFDTTSRKGSYALRKQWPSDGRS